MVLDEFYKKNDNFIKKLKENDGFKSLDKNAILTSVKELLPKIRLLKNDIEDYQIEGLLEVAHDLENYLDFVMFNYIKPGSEGEILVTLKGLIKGLVDCYYFSKEGLSTGANLNSKEKAGNENPILENMFEYQEETVDSYSFEKEEVANKKTISSYEDELKKFLQGTGKEELKELSSFKGEKGNFYFIHLKNRKNLSFHHYFKDVLSKIQKMSGFLQSDYDQNGDSSNINILFFSKHEKDEFERELGIVFNDDDHFVVVELDLILNKDFNNMEDECSLQEAFDRLNFYLNELDANGGASYRKFMSGAVNSVFSMLKLFNCKDLLVELKKNFPNNNLVLGGSAVMLPYSTFRIFKELISVLLTTINPGHGFSANIEFGEKNKEYVLYFSAEPIAKFETLANFNDNKIDVKNIFNFVENLKGSVLAKKLDNKFYLEFCLPKGIRSEVFYACESNGKKILIPPFFVKRQFVFDKNNLFYDVNKNSIFFDGKTMHLIHDEYGNILSQNSQDGKFHGVLLDIFGSVYVLCFSSISSLKEFVVLVENKFSNPHFKSEELFKVDINNFLK